MYSSLGIAQWASPAPSSGRCCDQQAGDDPAMIFFFVAMAASMFGAFELALPVELVQTLPVAEWAAGLPRRLSDGPGRGSNRRARHWPPPALLLFVGTQQSVVLGVRCCLSMRWAWACCFIIIAGFVPDAAQVWGVDGCDQAHVRRHHAGRRAVLRAHLLSPLRDVRQSQPDLPSAFTAR